MPHEWKVRSMDERDSRAAVAAAERAKVTTAVWLGRVIREALERERTVLTGEVLEPEDAAVDPGPSPVADPRVTLEALITIGTSPELPKWLRQGAARHIGTTIQVDRPVRGPRKALQAPEPEDMQKAVDALLER
jgi:hypothetical protein